MTKSIARDAGTGGSTRYLRNAPPALIQLHGRVGNGSSVLARLLTDARMRRSWTTLPRYIKRDVEWRGLWSEIANALHQAKTPKLRRARNRDSYRRIGSAVRKLAGSIEGGVLDLKAYEVFPNEVMNINGAASWQRLDSLERAEKAGQLLNEWPSVPEMLQELAVIADALCSDAMQAPSPVERLTRASRTTAFVWQLSAYFNRTYGQPLYGTVAAIASVALDEDVTKGFVAQVVKRKKG